MKKVKVRNPIAHANGGVSQGKTITGKKIDASKLQEGSLEVFQARKKLKAMFEEFKGKIKTCEMPKLAHYFRIGYGSRADYKDFGHKIWDIPDPNKGITKYWDIKLSKNFATNAAWENWSRNYYPQIMQRLYGNINDYFSITYPKRILEIAEITDKSEKEAKENKLKKELEAIVLDNHIKEVIREGEADYQSIFDCIKTFVLYPQKVLEHQFKYVNEVERQEGMNAAAMKSYANEKHKFYNTGNFCSTIDTINGKYSWVNNQNKSLYSQALRQLPTSDFADILRDNITAATDFISKFEAVDIGITISEDYTDNVATADINQTGGLQYGNGSNKSMTSDKKMLLLGAGILGILFIIKKKKK
ncbi:MAG: hypothetical protein ACI3Z9_01955 [Candidatus Onthomorpha sp.]